MAKAAKPEIEPDKDYLVRLKKPAQIGGVILKPSAAEIRVRGRILIQILDAVLTFEDSGA
jgi:hypothetical protein